jgi:hypothetical protein
MKGVAVEVRAMVAPEFTLEVLDRAAHYWRDDRYVFTTSPPSKTCE